MAYGCTSRTYILSCNVVIPHAPVETYQVSGKYLVTLFYHDERSMDCDRIVISTSLDKPFITTTDGIKFRIGRAIVMVTDRITIDDVVIADAPNVDLALFQPE